MHISLEQNLFKLAKSANVHSYGYSSAREYMHFPITKFDLVLVAVGSLLWNINLANKLSMR